MRGRAEGGTEGGKGGGREIYIAFQRDTWERECSTSSHAIVLSRCILMKEQSSND